MEQERIGQAVKAIAPDTLRTVGPRNRQAAGNIRKVGMECRVKADQLRHVGPEASYGLDQLNFVRQMIRRKAHELLECRDPLCAAASRINRPRPAVNDAMTDAGQRMRPKPLSDAL